MLDGGNNPEEFPGMFFALIQEAVQLRETVSKLGFGLRVKKGGSKCHSPSHSCLISKFSQNHFLFLSSVLTKKQLTPFNHIHGVKGMAEKSIKRDAKKRGPEDARSLISSSRFHPSFGVEKVLEEKKLRRESH